MKIRINKKIFLIVLAFFIVIQSGFLTLGYVNGLWVKNSSTLEEFAVGVREKCMGSIYKPSCYDKEIPKLMDQISMEEAFQVAKLIQQEDKEYTYCHVLGHNLSARETKKDPSKWYEIISRCPTTICNNGCLHGPLLEVFRSESLTDAEIEEIVPKLMTVCEPRDNWSPLPIETSMCYHGIGHLAMYMTDADIDRSIELCRTITVESDHTITCIQAVFMQLFQPLDPEDVALVKGMTPEREEVQKFCNKYRDIEKGACYREAWPLFKDMIGSADGAREYCSFLSYDEYEERMCYSGLMSINTVHFLIARNDENELFEFCINLPNPHDNHCFADAAKRLIQIDPDYVPEAISVCSLSERVGFQETCFKELVLYAEKTLPPLSEEYRVMCVSLPQKFVEECRAGYEGKINF